MPHIEAILGPNGEPLLLIAGKPAEQAVWDEQEKAGKMPPPDELIIVLPFEYLAEFALVGISNELDKERAKTPGEASISEPL